MTKDLIIKNEDIYIKDGDFVVAESDTQHIEHILQSEKGYYKTLPLVGVGITKFLNMVKSPQEILKIKREIAIQLEMDGYLFEKIEIDNNGIINIKAERKQ